jgi:hypothetical protein
MVGEAIVEAKDNDLEIKIMNTHNLIYLQCPNPLISPTI